VAVPPRGVEEDKTPPGLPTGGGEKEILGGGVMHQEQLFPMIRAKFKELLNGYIVTEEMDHLDEYIVPASLNDDQGIMGSIKLAMDACE
jgi:fructokinase